MNAANEKRLIDANALLEQFSKCNFKGRVMKDLIEEQPTADAVEVVRCKDCKFADEFGEFNASVCHRRNNVVLSDDFCSYGERREGE